MPESKYEELWLLDPEAIATPPPRVQGLPTLDAEALQTWINKIHQFQHHTRHTPQPQQPDLFGGIEVHPGDPYLVDPLALESYPFNFYEQRGTIGPKQPAIYFVRDRQAEIILYIGEAKNAYTRWSSVHDCKRYVTNYRTLHFECQSSCDIDIAFWLDAFPDAQRRQEQEQTLIQRWRSPFNKENWQYWATPFTGGRTPS
ncbi:MAG: GIY-YIG nuclease family protein [Cyanobacteria bacterium P01_D01_bin.73]